MAIGRSRKLMERIKKARNAKTGRFVTTHAKSGRIVVGVRKKSVGRSVPKTRTSSPDRRYRSSAAVRTRRSASGSRKSFTVPSAWL